VARTASREELRRFWAYTAEAWRRGHLHRINLARIAANAWRDLSLMASFYTHLNGSRATTP
jgi:hypothetical protein